MAGILCFILVADSMGSPITSQRGSAWQCYIGRWLSIGKHEFFHLLAWKNPWKF